MQHDSDSPLGQAGLILLEKGRYERYLLRADLANHSSEDTQLDVHLGCIVFCLIFVDSINISRRGLSRVAYPEQGKARARTWDERGVEHPRLYI